MVYSTNLHLWARHFNNFFLEKKIKRRQKNQRKSQKNPRKSHTCIDFLVEFKITTPGELDRLSTFLKKKTPLQRYLMNIEQLSCAQESGEVWKYWPVLYRLYNFKWQTKPLLRSLRLRNGRKNNRRLQVFLSRWLLWVWIFTDFLIKTFKNALKLEFLQMTKIVKYWQKRS